VNSPMEASPGTCVACARPCAQPRCPYCGAARSPGGLRVRRVLSQSVHGRLYLAADAAGRPVAIKELVFAHAPDATKVEAFERESRLLGAFSHPLIPRLRDAFAEGEGAQVRFYLVQDYVPGESLEARLEHHRYDEAEARDIAREVLRVLDFLHSSQPPVLHRDIKPANLIRREDGAIVLVDFGSARALQDGRTHEATLNGTFGYMPPEQLGGSVSTRSDLYALGATLLHLLSRRAPETLLSGDWELSFPREVHVSDHFRAFLRRLVARRPEDRFPSAAAALEALDAPPPRTFPRWLLVAAGAVLLVGAGAFVWARGGAGPATPPRPPAQAPAAVSAPPKPEQPKPPEPPKPRPRPTRVKPVAYWPMEGAARDSTLFRDSESGPPFRGSGVDPAYGVSGSAVLLGGKGFLVLEPQEGGRSGFGTLTEGALSLWLSRERPGGGPVVTTYAGTERVLQLRLDEEGRLRFGLGGSWLVSHAPLASGRFVHIALEWGPEGKSLWVDGHQVNQDRVPAPAGGIGEGLRIGWDALAPEELAPAVAVDEVVLRATLPPTDTWHYESMARSSSSPEPKGPAQGRIWPPVNLRLADSGDIELPPSRSFSGRPGECRKRRLHLDGLELSTGIDNKTYFSVSISFRLGTGCSADVPLALSGDMRHPGEDTEMRLFQGRQAVGHHTETLTISLPAGKRSSVLGIGKREDLAAGEPGYHLPVVKFWIDWEKRTVHRMVRVEGRMLDARKKPLPWFRVLAEGPWGSVQGETGREGQYHFDLPPGTWTVGPTKRKVQVAGARAIRVPDVLVPDPKVEPGKIGVQLVRSGDVVMFQNVMRSSPAERAGVLPGDVLETVNDTVIKTVEEAQRHLGGEPGTRIRIVVRRKDGPHTLDVTRAR
jgi:hypothetical protein